MYEFFYYLDQLFKIIFQTSITGSILICLILIFRRFYKERIGIKFQYALWFLVILRLTIFKLPESTLSMFNLINKLGKNILLLIPNREVHFGSMLEKGSSQASSMSNHDVILGTINSIDFSNNEINGYSLSGLTILSFYMAYGHSVYTLIYTICI